MSGIIICKTKTADNPYTFLNTKITIYSYEELCYYIFNNMVLIGKDDLADRLSNWLRTAIDMEDLADKIDALNAKNAYIQDIMVEILTFGEFYSKDEVKEFMDECKRIRTLKPYELDKKRADSYMMYKHYIKADAIYDDIIEYKESHGEYDEFLGNIYHNKGVALAGNLQLEEAKDAFRNPQGRADAPSAPYCADRGKAGTQERDLRPEGRFPAGTSGGTVRHAALSG